MNTTFGPARDTVMIMVYTWCRSEEGTVRVVEQFCFPLLTTCVFLLFEVPLSFFCARAETSDLCCFVLPSLERAVVVVPESSWYIYSNPWRPLNNHGG